MSKLNWFGGGAVVAVVIAAGLGGAMSARAQDITGFRNGYITFTNENPALYYRIEFKPNLNDSVNWDGTFRDLRNIQSSDTEVTVPVGVFYRVVGRDSPWVAGTALETDILTGKTAYVNDQEITGTMANIGQTNITPGATAQTIPQGYHDGTGSVAGDADLAAAYIKSGVTIFTVEGTVVESTGDATVGQVLSAATFSKAGEAGLIGTMANIGQTNITPGTTAQTIPQGYHNGTGSVAGDADLAAANIKAGTAIFGVTGTMYNAAVPKTGQTTNTRTGDDGDLEKGVAWPNPRFTVTTNGTDEVVADNLTGLMWVKSPHLLSGNSDTMTWNNAIDFCNGLTLAGHSDWRLPNVRELQSLLDYGRNDPALPTGHPFTGVQSGYYWSSSASAGNTANAWHVTLYQGFVRAYPKGFAYYVCPVRAGQ